MGESDSVASAVIPTDTVKVVAESLGITNLPDDSAKELADDITYRLKLIIQDASKFMHHSKRQKLLSPDIDNSLKVKNIEPLYGIITRDHIPFRYASGGGRELFFVEEKDIDLNDLVATQPIKLPLDVSIRAHWLAIDGVQPTIPENPPPMDVDVQKLESVDPITKLAKGSVDGKDVAGKPTTGKVHKLRNVEAVHVKQLATHELSVEQQLYYKEITEACVGADEGRRAEALQSLSCDPGLHEMLPRMCTFISEGVKVNVVQHNLALLIYLMRMVKALLENPSLYLEKYLHELIPSVATCIVSKQLCVRPEADNHWALRGFAARLMATICKNFNTSTNNIQTRVTRMFARAVDDEKVQIPSLHGAIEALSELGPEVVKVFILPKAKLISERIDNCTDKAAVSQIKQLLIKVLTNVLKTRPGPDLGEEYRAEFGSLGPALHSAVCKARMTSQPSPNQSTVVQSVSGNDLVLTQNMMSSRALVVGNIARTQQIPSASQQQKYVIVTSRSSSNPSTSGGTSGMQKQVFVTQQPQTIKIEPDETVIQ